MKMGDPLDEATDIGTIISKDQFAKVDGFIKEGLATPGATGRAASAMPTDPAARRTGCSCARYIFTGLPNESRLVQEEIFGPVTVVFPFDDVEAVLAAANGTEYGLAASLWTNNLKVGLDLAHRLESGLVQINQNLVVQANLSYGGVKSSGLGKEASLESMLEHFMHKKTIMVNYALTVMPKSEPSIPSPRCTRSPADVLVRPGRMRCAPWWPCASTVPDDAFTANMLGTERAGSAVHIRPGVVPDHRLSDHRGRERVAVLGRGTGRQCRVTRWRMTRRPGVRPGAGAGQDQAAGAGAGRQRRRAAGRSAWIFAAAGGRRHAVAAKVAGRQEFPGYWEYLLDDAIFTTPAHPFWGGGGADRRRREAARHRVPGVAEGRRVRPQAGHEHGRCPRSCWCRSWTT